MRQGRRTFLQESDGSTGRRNSYNCIGADASVEGGLSRFPGFINLADLDPSQIEDWNFGSDPTPAAYRVIDFYPFSARIQHYSQMYGFVYRVENGVGGDDHIFVQYRINEETTWRHKELMAGIDNGTNWKVEVVGRLVYVFAQGESPVLFYVEEETPGIFTEVLSDTGPGTQAMLISPDQAGALNTVSLVGAESSGGQVSLIEDGPTDTGLFTDPPQSGDVRKIRPGTYIFAFQLIDSRTGRKSGLSKRAVARSTYFTYPVPEGEETPAPSYNYAVIEIAYETDKWDKFEIYRSVRTESAGGPYSANLHLSQTGILEEYLTDSQPGGNVGRALIFYDLHDIELAAQKTWLDERIFDEDVPPGGEALFYEGTMLVSDIVPLEADVDERKGLGELRYSALGESNPELFPTSNVRTPTLPTDTMIRLMEVGGNVIGFSQRGISHIRKEFYYINVEDIHSGVRLVNKRAASEIATLGFFVTDQGLKIVMSNGNMDEVVIMDQTIVEEWRTTRASISLAYDSVMGVLFVLNADAEEANLFWFNTKKMTQLHDMQFKVCDEGKWPLIPTDTSTALVDRAMFLRSSGQGANGGVFQVLTPNYLRTGTKRTLMPVTGDTRHEITTKDVNILTLDGTVTEDMLGLYVYVIWGTNIGARSKVASLNVGAGQLILEDASDFAEGDTIGVSPVVFEWTSTVLGLSVEGEYPVGMEDRMMRRKIKSLQTVWTGVSGDADGENEAVWSAKLWEADNADARAEAWPTDREGTVYPAHLQDGPSPFSAAFGATKLGLEGSSPAVGVRVVCPDLDFTLLGVAVSGTIESSTRVRRAE